MQKTPESFNSSATPLKPLLFRLFLLFAVVAILVAMTVGTLFYARKTVVSRLTGNSFQEGSISIQTGAYRWISLSELSISDLTIRSAETVSLECPEARFQFRLVLQPPYVAISEIYLDRPSIRLEKDSHGGLLFPGFKETKNRTDKSPSPKIPDSFPLPRIHVDSGSIEARQNGRTVLTVRNVTGEFSLLKAEGPDGWKFRLDFGDIGKKTTR